MLTSSSSKNELEIFRGGIKAGTLRRTENGCEFVYAQEFIGSSRYKGLAYKMAKSKLPITIHGTNLHPFFAGLLPEGLRLKALVRNIKTSEDDLFSLFAAIGAHVIGDVYVKRDASEREPAVPKLKDIDFYEYFQSLLSQDTYSLGEDALSGVQDKISASMINFPLNIAKATKAYILKLDPKDKPGLVQNELCCMTLAARCGIEIPKVKLVKDKKGNLGLLVERFDRIWDDDASALKMIHQEDGCQFLERYPADKYNLSFNEIATGVKQIATAPHASLLKLLRLYCYSYVIGNGDLHAKNISLMTHPDQQVTDVTPAYDLITTHVYSDQNMAIMFDGKKDNITRKMIRAFGERFGVNERATTKMLDRLIKDISKNRALLRAIPTEEKRMTNLMKLIDKRLADISVHG